MNALYYRYLGPAHLKGLDQYKVELVLIEIYLILIYVDHLV